MLVQETQMDAKAKQKAKFIIDGAARMSTLVDDLLSFASTGITKRPDVLTCSMLWRRPH
jgi:light-regulated signal transduction histidine kinase (bacteriophytochrome)